MDPHHIVVSALRLRNIPRSTFLRLPSTQVEIHTLPGGIPATSTPIIPKTSSPAWRGFKFIHNVSLCGPVPLAFVVREAAVGVLGTVIISVDAAHLEGWYSLGTGGGELYIRVVRSGYCVRINNMCKQMYREEKVKEGEEKQRDGEMRKVSWRVGSLFRVGELRVVVEGSVPEGRGDLQVVMKLGGQTVKGWESLHSIQRWKHEKEKNSGMTTNHDENQVDSVEEKSDPVEVGEEEIVDVKPHMGKVLGNLIRTEGKRIVKTGARSVHTRAVPQATGYVDNLAAAKELHKFVRAANSYARGLKIKGEDITGGAYHVKPEEVRDEEAKVRNQRKETKVGLRLGEDEKKKLAVHGSLESKTDTQEDMNQPLESSPQTYLKKARSALEIEVHHVADTTNSFEKEVGDDEEVEDKEDDCEDSDSEDMNVVVKESTATGPEKSDVVRSRGRAAEFGSFRFALFHGQIPDAIDVLIQDTTAPLPAPLGLLQEHLVKVPKLDEFSCECKQHCHRHLFRIRLLGTDPGHSAILNLHIYYTKWEALATCNDVTPRFRELYSKKADLATTITNTFPQINHLSYFFVGGFFTKQYPNYFEKNIKYLQDKLGLTDVKAIEIHTEGSIDRNARIISDYIMKTNRQKKSVVLIGHSKGGVDAISVLYKFPQVVPFIYGIITFQCPFGGTYLIDYVSQSKLAVNTIGNAIQKIFKGDQDAFLDMGYTARLNELGLSEEDVAYAARGGDGGTCEDWREFNGTGRTSQDRKGHLNAFSLVPIIAYASSASFDPLKIRSAADVAGMASMAPAAQVITHHTGFACDGLVTPADALVPGADVVILNDMLHSEPALYVNGSKYPPGQLTASALLLLFERAAKGR